MTKVRKTIELLSFLLFLVSTIVWSSCRSEPDNIRELQAMLNASQKSVVYHSPKTNLSTFSLIDDLGQTFTPERFQNKWTLILVGYTSCPDVCPTALSALARAVPNLIKNHPHTDFEFVFLAVDPVRDKAIDLHQYAQHFHPNIRIVSGDTDEIDRMITFLGASYRIPSNQQGFYTVDHSTSLFVVDPNRQMVATVLHPHDAPTIVHGFSKIDEHFSRHRIDQTQVNRKASSLIIDQAWVLRPPPNATVAAGFCDIKNRGKGDVSIIRLESPQFNMVELHDIIHENGIGKMVHLSTPRVPTGQSLSLRPGAKHLMFIGPRHGQVMREESLDLVMVLKNGEKISTRFPFRNQSGSTEIRSRGDH